MQQHHLVDVHHGDCCTSLTQRMGVGTADALCSPCQHPGVQYQGMKCGILSKAAQWPVPCKAWLDLAMEGS